jgi:predicted dehydrogenase
MTIRLGIVGTGYWATHVHIPAALASDHVDLVGITGRDESRLAVLSLETSIRAFSSFDELLEQVDIVAFAIAPSAQAGLALTAARAGKHLMLEKPIATTLEAARRLEHEVSARGLAAIVFAAGLLMTPTAEWIEATRKLGPWNYARFESVSSTMRESTNPFYGSEWRRDAGALWDTGPHALSTLCAVLGRVRTVHATRGRDDLIALSLSHSTGAVSSLVVGSHTTSTGALSSSIITGDAGVVSPPAIPDWEAASLVAYGHALAHLSDQIERGATPHASNIGLGLHVVEILDAAERSLRSGTIARLHD